MKRKKINKTVKLGKDDQLTYCIYGLINTKTNQLVYVSLDQETAELELDLGEFDDGNHALVSFTVMLT
jgi:hypothetical protein